jgi:toxin HigB-1
MLRPNLWFCRVLFCCTRTMGAVGTRPSLRPPFSEGDVGKASGVSAPRERELPCPRSPNDVCKTAIDIVKSYFTLRIIGAEAMIESFKHKGLRQLFEEDNARGVNAEHLRKIRQILAVLDVAETIDALDLPTFHLHPLQGDLKGFWAVTVRANWRIVFRFEDGAARDVDLVDYH